MRSPRGRKEKWIGAWHGTATRNATAHAAVAGTQFIWDPTKHSNATAVYLEAITKTSNPIAPAHAELYDLTNSAVISNATVANISTLDTAASAVARSNNNTAGGATVNILANLPTSAATIVVRIWSDSVLRTTTLYASALVIEER